MIRLQSFLAKLRTGDREIRIAFRRWWQLGRAAKLYLVHVALLTSNLAISALFFNLAVEALGYPRSFLGELNVLSFIVAAITSFPLWWLVTRIGLRSALLGSALFQAIGIGMIALWPTSSMLMLVVGLQGVAAVLFQVSAPPLMMRYSDSETRDYLFSANAAINIGFAGIGKWLGGGLPTQFGHLLGVHAESAVAYQAAFACAAGGVLLSLIPLLFIDETPAVRQPIAQMPQPSLPPHTSPSEQERPKRAFLKIIDSSAWLQRLPASWRTLFVHPIPLIQLLVPPLCISCGAALLIPYLNLFFKDRFRIDDQSLGLIFALLDVGTGLAALIVPLVAVRLGKIHTIVLAQFLSIPFLLVLGFFPVLNIAVGAALLRGMLFNMGAPLYDAFAMERTDEAARPLVIGLINGAYTGGYLFAPYISTHVQEQYGFTPLFLGTTVCYCIAATANYIFFVRKRSQ